MEYNYEEDLEMRVQTALRKIRAGLDPEVNVFGRKGSTQEALIIFKIQGVIDMIVNGCSVESAIEFYFRGR